MFLREAYERIQCRSFDSVSDRTGPCEFECSDAERATVVCNSGAVPMVGFIKLIGCNTRQNLVSEFRIGILV